jgi:hypothetical protein
MVFFLQRRIQHLQLRVLKLWSYSGSADPSRMSDQDLEKKGLDKRVRSLTTLTTQNEIPALTAAFFESAHPLPAVCALLLDNIDCCSPFSCVVCCFANTFSANVLL